jgi:DNA-binding beta-propeller fold protein YncE
MINSENNRINLICEVRYFTLVLLFFLAFIPPQIDAQQLGTIITYQDSITLDEEGGKIFFPVFVYTDPNTNEVYVVDGKARIIIFTEDLFPLHTLSKKDGIVSPQGLTIDSNGNLYVGQAATEKNPRHRISVYNPCLKWERDIYLEGVEGVESFIPYRLAVDKKGNIFVTSSFYPGVLYIDGNGHLIDIISPEEEGKKVPLTNVTLDNDGNIYLVSEEQGRIYVYNEERHFIFKFGEKGGSSGKLSRPKAVGIDNRNGRKFVVDYMRHTITVYNREGRFIFEFGGLGWGDGWFQYPTDLAVDTKGRILVADLFNHRVQVFNSW